MNPFDAFLPPPDITIDEWACQYRILPPTTPEPGLWKTSRTPYLKEVMDAVNEHTQVAVMKSAQVGGSAVMENIIGAVMSLYGGPMMIVQPTEHLAREWSLKRCTPLVDNTPSIKDLLGRDTNNPDNTLLYKNWGNGFLRVAWSRSAAQLRSDAIQWLLLDEVDAYPHDVGGEGDPVNLALARTTTFGARSRTVYISTPTDGHSRIKLLFDNGDRRIWHSPCPDCAADVAFDEKMEDLLQQDGTIYCPHCGSVWEEMTKHHLLKHGHWVPTNPEGQYPSFHITGFMSPPGWLTWAEISKRKTNSQISEEQRRTYYNTVIGVPYAPVQTHEVMQWEPLYYRRGVKPAPADVIIKTAGVDVQGDRIEVEVIGWGKDMRSWSLEHHVLHGDPTQADVWQLLTPFSEKVDLMAIDTGYIPEDVRRWAYGKSNVMMIKGLTRGSGKLVKQTAPDQPWMINTNILKEQVYAWLDLKPQRTPPRGWCEFGDYPEEYFRQLCAERVEFTATGVRWVKIRDRNEILDLRCYALAAAIVMGAMNWTDEQWEARQKQAAVPAPPQRQSRFRKSQWLS